MNAAWVMALGLVVASSEAQPQPETRLVTIGAAVTEIVRDLGLGHEVVGIDSTSVDILPEDPKSLGFFRRVSVGGSLSLKPTHVLAVEDAGPPSLFTTLESAGVRVTRVVSAKTAPEAIDRIRRISQALGRVDEGEALVRRVEAELAQAKRPSEPPSVLFIYARGPGTVMVAGGDTGPDGVIQLAGGRNAVTAFDGFKPFSAEAVLAAAPDVLLLTDGGLASLGGTQGVAAHPVLGQTPAVKAGRIVAMDDLALLGFGPRLGQVVQDLAEALNGQ